MWYDCHLANCLLGITMTMKLTTLRKATNKSPKIEHASEKHCLEI